MKSMLKLWRAKWSNAIPNSSPNKIEVNGYSLNQQKDWKKQAKKRLNYVYWSDFTILGWEDTTFPNAKMSTHWSLFRWPSFACTTYNP
jgi:hypothetical protein